MPGARPEKGKMGSREWRVGSGKKGTGNRGW